MDLPLNTPSPWHVVHACVACTPSSGNAVVAWLNVACCQFASETLWQVSHAVGKPAWTWLGFLVLLKSVWWQETHAVDLPLNTPSPWHVVHGLRRVDAQQRERRRRVVERVACCQLVSDTLWQVSQAVGKPACTWLGFLLLLKSVWWQETHAVDLPLNTPSPWQLAHGCVAWTPSSGNAVVAWLNVRLLPVRVGDLVAGLAGGGEAGLRVVGVLACC